MSAAIYHVGLTVTDVERSRRFYEGAFGFVFDRDLRMEPAQLQPLMQLDPPSSIHAVYLMLGGFTLELMQWDPPARPAADGRGFLETGLAHLSILVEDMADTLAKVANVGGTVLADVGRAAMVRDPDGQLIELLDAEVGAETERGRAARAAAARETGERS